MTDWSTLKAPTLDDFEVIAKAAFDALPEPFKGLVQGVPCSVQEFADEETLESLYSASAQLETLLAMTSKGFGIAIVVEAESGKLTGVVTDGDLRRNMAGLMDRTAGEIATARPVCARADMLAAEALALMNRHEISVLPVIDEAGLPLGLLHVHDLLRAGVA